MMTRNQSNERGQLEMLTIDQLVPKISFSAQAGVCHEFFIHLSLG